MDRIDRLVNTGKGRRWFLMMRWGKEYVYCSACCGAEFFRDRLEFSSSSHSFPVCVTVPDVSSLCVTLTARHRITSSPNFLVLADHSGEMPLIMGAKSNPVTARKRTLPTQIHPPNSARSNPRHNSKAQIPRRRKLHPTPPPFPKSNHSGQPKIEYQGPTSHKNTSITSGNTATHTGERKTIGPIWPQTCPLEQQQHLVIQQEHQQQHLTE